MTPSLAVLVGFLQTAAHPLPARAPRAPDPVRVWRTDSTAYVTLQQPGHLLLLHVDGIGRIRVLFPLTPDDSTSATANAPVAVSLPPTAQGNPSTFVAVWSRWPFEFAALRSGPAWDYTDALLLLPTAGDPLAALLDIAERVTDGRPYDFGVVTYLGNGSVVARRTPLAPDVCLSCVRHGTAVAAVAAQAPTNAVDCSNASLTNSFCGVNSGSVSIASAPPPPPQVVYQPAPAAPVYVPYFLPMTHGFRRRFEQPPPPPVAPAPRSQGVAYPIAPRLVVPSRSELGTFTGRHR
jgi:hypothetical protein